MPMRTDYGARALHALAESAPEHAAALLMGQAAAAAQMAADLLEKAGHRVDASAYDRVRLLRGMAAAAAYQSKRCAASLLDERIEGLVADLIERFPDYDRTFDSFRGATRAIVEFLLYMEGDGWELDVLCPDGVDVDAHGRHFVHGWAFAIIGDEDGDTTSYCRPPNPRDPTDHDYEIEWYGTAWESERDVE